LIHVEEELKALRIEMNIRFDSIISKINARFEAQKQESDAKFEAMNARFEAINARFEALDKRLSSLQWLIVFGFTFISVVITLLNFLK